MLVPMPPEGNGGYSVVRKPICMPVLALQNDATALDEGSNDSQNSGSSLRDLPPLASLCIRVPLCGVHSVLFVDGPTPPKLASEFAGNSNPQENQRGLEYAEPEKQPALPE